MIKVFSTEHLRSIFAETPYESVRNLMFDLAMGNDIVDDGKIIGKQEANDKLRKFVYQILDIHEEKPSKRTLHRAMRKHGEELFEVIEEVVDLKIEEGLRENDFFMQYVDRRSIANDDIIEFVTNDDTLLSVAKVSGQHHDFVLQRLGRGERFTVKQEVYGAAVGAQIDRYLVGQDDWAALVNAVAKAFQNELINQIYAAFGDAYKKLPASPTLIGNNTLVKDTFDEIISNVEAINGCPAVIVGTKTALKKLNALTDVDWRAQSQKESVANTGRLGTYEGTELVEIPQRFLDKTLTQKAFDDKILLILPVMEDKFVKVVDQGETEIYQVTEKGEENGRWDDVMKYEMTRGFGVGVQLGRYFGMWTLPA